MPDATVASDGIGERRHPPKESREMHYYKRVLIIAVEGDGPLVDFGFALGFG